MKPNVSGDRMIIQVGKNTRKIERATTIQIRLLPCPHNHIKTVKKIMFFRVSLRLLLED
jgi:hypothetical protein